MAQPMETVRITEPGVYDLPPEVYHSDPVPGGSLSSSGARKILTTCPAEYRYWATHPTPRASTAFDVGTAAHRRLLGVGGDVVVVDAENWRTKAAQEQQRAARLAGHTPLLRREADAVAEMVDAVHAHPIAQALFATGTGKAEQSLFWADRGIIRRAMIDWLPSDRDRMVIPDLKTTTNVHPRALAKSVAEYGYHCQAAWYMDAVTGTGLVDPDRVAFVLVFVQKTPPYLVEVVQPDPTAIAYGQRQNQRAIDLYQRCVETGTWPGYSTGVTSLSLPAWQIREYEKQLEGASA